MGVAVSPEFVVLLLVLLTALAFVGYRLRKRQRKAKFKTKGNTTDRAPDSKSPPPDFKVSYAQPEYEWSGNSIGDLPVKTLTYKQYECLEDARYGFRIVGVTPTERKNEQPHKTRAHGMKTVASLVKHGFLIPDGDDGHIITDHGLNALEVCDVRY